MTLRAIMALATFAVATGAQAAEIKANGQAAQLDIRSAGEHSIRVTLKPISFQPDFPYTPALALRKYAAPAISLREIMEPVKARVGGLNVEVLPSPLTVIATRTGGEIIQRLIFQEDGSLSFQLGG